MGMSTHVKGFVSSFDDTYLKHADVLKACIKAGIKKLPEETAKYFGDDSPEEYLLEDKLEIEIPIHKYEGEMEEGFDIIVSEIPEGVYRIRFYNSW